MKKLVWITFGWVLAASAFATEPLRYNIILVFADDISARELPAYEASVWAPPVGFGRNSQDPQFRAKTPVLDKIAEEGALIRTAWANAVCSPARATLMTGRYAHIHKWWQNNDIGKYRDENGKLRIWPLYESSPHMIGHVAQQAGYNTYWVGKTQMNKGGQDISRFGFDVVVTSPGGDISLDYRKFIHSDFIHENLAKAQRHKDTPKYVPFISADTGLPLKAVWSNASFFWMPFVGTYNYPKGTGEWHWWPQTREDASSYGLATYGPDVEMRFNLEFMEESQREGKPFFIYHTPHLGHTAFNYLGQKSGGKHLEHLYPGTPKIAWDGEAYTRTPPRITGDRGEYNTHGTVTDPGMHHHVEYLDYQMWQYLEKLEELGITDETIIIFTADNGTVGHGKMQIDRQRGPHVPFFVHVPGMKKQGMQDILMDITDLLPTVAEVAGTELPDDYELNGTSLIPYLMGETDEHRDWVYSYLYEKQLIRGHKVLRDGNGDWWDVETDPADYDSYPKIRDWDSVSEEHRNERDRLHQILPVFDKHATEHGAPSLDSK
jgi:arylsulfatase A-like enzyme